jgi:hypothetical protein
MNLTLNNSANMNVKADRPPLKKMSLENEVIISVVFLYFVISSALLLIHHLQPEDAVTLTSSPSPSHASFYVGDRRTEPALAPSIEQNEVQAWIEHAGYREVRDLRQDGKLWRATAVKDGQTWDLQIDPRPIIVVTPTAAPSVR